MEAKKNPSKDVHRMRGMFFQIGLGISVALMITAFEWRTEVKKVSLRVKDEPVIETLIIPNTDPKDPPPPSLLKDEVKPITSVSFTPVVLSTSPMTDPTSDPPIVLDPTLLLSISYLPAVDDPELGEEIVVFPEKPAEPIGGYEAFYKMMRANLKYPRNAQRYDVAGKVFVEFVVNRDGSPVDMKVIRGIGYGCDEEAIRVIGLSKWNPGKQRGRPVRVKMVMPITFKLN